MNRVDWNDVGVLKPGEDPGLIPLRARHLEGYQAMPQAQLLRQEDPGERPPAKFQDKTKTRQLLTDPW